MILLVIMIIPLGAAVLSSIFPRPRIGSTVTLIAAVAVLCLVVTSALKITASSEHLLTAIPDWVALDAPGALMLIIVAFISMTASLFSTGYMDFTKKDGVRRYYSNFNLFVFSMVIIPLIQEPGIVWIAVEFTTLFSVLLVGFEGTHEALEAAWKYVVLTLMGAAVALLGFLILFWAARQAGVTLYTWSGLVAGGSKMPPVLLQSAFVLILVGFGAKVGLVPLHTWLPDAHSQAPTPVCALLSGVETTVVLYVILRLLAIVDAVPTIHANTWFLVFGIISVGTAAFLLFQVRDYKRLFAFSTIEHMGIIMSAVGLGGASAYSGAMLQMVGHAVTKSFCFYASGCVLILMETRDIASVRGLIRKAPGTGTALLLGGLAIAGSPPFVVFLGEFSILKTGLQQGKYLAVGLLVFFIVIAFIAIMNHISRMVFGVGEEIKPVGKRPDPFPLSCKITLILTAVPLITLGIFIPGVLNGLIVLAAATIGG